MNNWNELLLIKKLHRKPMIRNQAALYLNQLNTASKDQIKREVEAFIIENKVKS